MLLEEQIDEARRDRPRMIGDFIHFPSVIVEEATLEEQLERVLSSTIKLIGLDYEPASKPFDLTLNEFLKLPLDVAQEVYTKAFGLSKSMLSEAWKKGIKQVIVCDKKIVHESKSNEDIPSELVGQLAKQYNKACYVFSSPDVVEECCSWTQIDDHDSYPTICMHVGSENLSDSDLIDKTTPIATDFDTGNPYYRVFDANQFSGPLASFTALEMAHGTHLGLNYTYFQKKVKIGVKDETGAIHSIVRKVRLIRDWQGSAYLLTSPKRVGFVGRDVLRDLRVKLELDPLKKITRILN